MKKLKIILRALLVVVDFLVVLPVRILLLIYIIAYAIYGKLKYKITFTEILSKFIHGAKEQCKINIKCVNGEVEFKNYYLFDSRKEQ